MTETSAPPVAPTDPMDRWSVTDLNTWTSPKGNRAFRSTVRHDGSPVLEVVNHGYGGCHDYQPLPGAPDGVLARLEADAEAWFDLHGREDKKFEMTDNWVWWCVYHRPSGQIAADYLAQF